MWLWTVCLKLEQMTDDTIIDSMKDTDSQENRVTMKMSKLKSKFQVLVVVYLAVMSADFSFSPEKQF